MAANNLQINVNVGGNALSQLQKVQSQIRSTDNVVKKSARGYTVFGAAADKATDRSRRFAQAGIQQAGFQLGDFAVQLQNGTHFLTAFGQQGSQLLGVFGAVGAVLGAVVAVGAALGTVFLKMQDSAGTLTEELDELEDSVKDLSGFAITNEERFEKLRKKYGEVTEGVNKLFEAQKKLAQFELQNQLMKTITALKSELEVIDDLARSQDGLTQAQTKGGKQVVLAQRNLAQAIKRVREEFDLSKTQAEALGVAMGKLGELDPFKQPAEAAKEVQAIFDLISTDLENLSVEEREAAGNLLRLAEQLRTVAATQKNLATDAVNAIGLSADQMDDLAKGMASAFGNSFKGIIKGTESVADAFRSMALSIIDQLLQVLVVQQLVSGISTGLQSAFPKLFPKQAAIGGSVQRGQPVLVGERGAEMFVPSSSGSIIPNKELSGGSGVTVNQTINVTTGVQQTVRSEIINMLPQISQATQAAVADSRLRGGSFSKAFGG